MRSFKLLGLALLAVFASAVALSSSAFGLALPENLPTVAFERTWTGASDGAEPELSGGGLEPVVCEKAPAEGTEEAGKPLGLFHIRFEKCKTLNTKAVCTGLGDAAGTILSLGSWHLVFDKKTPELLTAVLFLVEHLHFNCTALVLLLVLGTLLCLHLEATSQKTTHLFHCVVQSNGEQEDKTYFMEDGTELNAGLLCGVNEPASEKPCVELALGSVTYLEAIFADV